MALFSASDFTGFTSTFAVPSGISDVLFAGSVDLILSTGITQQVFDTLSTALKCIHYMEANKLYSLSPNEDVTILNLRSKLLILENTYINQKMMNSYVCRDDLSREVWRTRRLSRPSKTIRGYGRCSKVMSQMSATSASLLVSLSLLLLYSYYYYHHYYYYCY